MPEYIVGIRITSSSDTAAIAAAQKTLGAVHAEQLKVVSSGKAAGGAISGVGESLKNAAKQAVAYAAAFVGIQAVIRWLREARDAALGSETSLRRLENSIQGFAPQSSATAESVRAWAEALQSVTNVSHEASEAMVSRFLPVTKDVAAAQLLTTVAARAQKAGWLDAGEAADKLGNALMGRVARGADQLSRILYEGKLSGEDFSVTLGKVEAALDKAGGKAETAAQQLLRLKIQQDEANEAMGATMVRVQLAMLPAQRAWVTFKAMFVGGLQSIGAALKLGAQEALAYFQLLADVAPMSGLSLSQAWDKFNASMATSQGEFKTTQAGITSMLTDVVTVFDDNTTALDAIGKKVEAEARAKIAAAAARLKAERDAEKIKSDKEAAGSAIGKAAVDLKAAEREQIEQLIAAYSKELGAASTTAERKVILYQAEEDAVAELGLRQKAEIDAQETADIEATKKLVLNTADRASLEKTIHDTADTNRVNAKAKTVAQLEDIERQSTASTLAEAERRMRAEQEIDDQRAEAVISRNRAAIAILQTEAGNVFTSPERLAAITAEITLLKAETHALELNNIERQKQNALDLAGLQNKTPEEKSAIAGGFDKTKTDLGAAYAADVAADANAFDEKLQHLLTYGQASDAERKRQLAADLVAIKTRLAAVKAGSAEEAALIRAKNALNATANAEAVQGALGQAAAVVGTLQGAFAQSRGLAAASAFINMIAGMVGALAPPPIGLGPVYGIPLAVAVGIAGVANIAKIMSTQSSGPGGGGGPSASEKAGFDNPEHDRMAYEGGVKGGRRWADDMQQEYGQGIDRGWRERMAQPAAAAGVANVTNAPVTNVTNITNVFSRAVDRVAQVISRVVEPFVTRVEYGVEKTRVAASPVSMGPTNLINTEAMSRMAERFVAAAPTVIERASRITERETVTNNTTATHGGTTINNNSYLWGPEARQGSKQAGRIIDRSKEAARRSLLSSGPEQIGGE